MEQYQITLMPRECRIPAEHGSTILESMIRAGLEVDAPCGGRGECGKCRVRLEDGSEALACRTEVLSDMTVWLAGRKQGMVLTSGPAVSTEPDGECEYALAFDVGTTTLVCWLLSGVTGMELARASRLNPQIAFGADVISRIEYAVNTDAAAPMEAVRAAMAELTWEVCDKAGISADSIGVVSIVGNTAMHHLLLGIDPRPLTVPPYMPKVFEAMELPAGEILPVCPNAAVRVLPNIAGFVGADTVGCMTALRLDRVEELTLLIDIGTNGEMVLMNGQRRIACSTAAGPAFEGAKIQCGMRGASGAVDHVHLENGALHFSVIGGGAPEGICGSGLLDLTAALLSRGDIDSTGRFRERKPICLGDSNVYLCQKDVRELQLAKAAIRAGIELLCRAMEVSPEQVGRVYLAGAFGNYLSPASACAIGMIPPVLLDRIEPVGNAAGAGARLCALSRREFEYSKRLAENTEFLELASTPDFQRCYLNCLNLGQDTE